MHKIFAQNLLYLELLRFLSLVTCLRAVFKRVFSTLPTFKMLMLKSVEMSFFLHINDFTERLALQGVFAYHEVVIDVDVQEHH